MSDNFKYNQNLKFNLKIIRIIKVWSSDLKLANAKSLYVQTNEISLKCITIKVN